MIRLNDHCSPSTCVRGGATQVDILASPNLSRRIYNRLLRGVAILAVMPGLVLGAEPTILTETAYKPDLGILIIQVNWGRTWKCGQYENAQLQALTFTKSSIEAAESTSLDLTTPSKLFVDNKYLPYAFVVAPGEYVLTEFDVKVSRSVSDVRHINGTKGSLIKDGKPLGGTFTVNPGEAVYVGHFGLDCGAEPFLWRSYIDGREDFERYISGFRAKYPFAKQLSVQFRLFSTQLFGNPFALKDPTVR